MLHRPSRLARVGVEKVEAVVEFCGERYAIAEGMVFTVGRDADLTVDDNPFLHRRFLQIHQDRGLWWITNVGSRLVATLSDGDGLFQAWIGPSAQLPLVFSTLSVWFTAGPTTYEFSISNAQAPFVFGNSQEFTIGATTTGKVSLTPEQTLLLLALAEPLLRRGQNGSANLRSSSDIAERLNWSMPKFNRKLDSICQKLEKMGVPGLHGGSEKLASNRRARLAEYAVASRLVKYDDLALLDGLGIC